MNSKKTLAVLLAAVSVSGAAFGAGCSKKSTKWQYPDRADTVLAEGEKSWEKWKEECPEGLEINWFTNVYMDINKKSVVTKAIKEKTGITVNFDSALGSTADKLSVMISSDTLPDVITVEKSDERFIQLADQGYLFPLNGLSGKWAPDLDFMGMQQTLTDGNIYGLPSFYYSSTSAGKLQTNGGMMVRKDWFEAYMEYVQDNIAESEQKAWDITTPDGCVKAMKWVRDNCLTSAEKDTYQGFMLDPFDTSKNNGNQGIAWLCQYFAVPFETEDGKYTDGIDMPEYLDMMKWLNELYREGLLTDEAISANTQAEVGRKIANGEVFITSCSPQDYPTYLKAAAFPKSGKSIEYTSFTVKNYNGDDPVLGDIAGTGYAVNCITKNASRPDIIIKLFDYLWSDEGQMLCGYGLEGNADENGNIISLADSDFAGKFTAADATWYKAANGEIRRTQSYLDLVKTEGVSDSQLESNQARLKELGLNEWQLFRRPQYFDTLNTGKKQATKENAYVNNMKLPLTIYSTDAYMITGGLIDPTRSDYSDLVKIDNQMNTIWSQSVLSMIQAKSAAEVETVFANGRKRLTSKGHDKLFDARAEVYAQKKSSQGIAWGYPHRDPNYKNAVISEYYTWEKNGKTYRDIFGAIGDVSYYIDYELIG